MTLPLALALVTEEDVTPYGLLCMDCEEPMRSGDVRVHRPTQEDPTIVEVICFDCGLGWMLGAA